MDVNLDTITKDKLFEKAQERFQSWAKMYSDPSVSIQSMYEDMACSVFSGYPDDDFSDEQPVLKDNFLFEYKGYQFELSSCTLATRKEQMLGITTENFTDRFPHGVFTDRYVCWMWRPNKSEMYLVPQAWSWGARFDLVSGKAVDKNILSKIDKFLEELQNE